MKLFVTTISFFFLVSCSTNPIEEKEETIVLTYIYCETGCANWMTIDDSEKILNIDSANTLVENPGIFIEPASDKLVLPDSLGFNGDVIKFTGHFHKEKGFPGGFHTDQPVEKARVFQFTSYTVITSNYSKPRGG